MTAPIHGGSYRWRSAIFWLALLGGASLIPLLIALPAAPPARGYWLEVGAGLGLLGLGLMVVQAVTSGRTTCVAPQFGADNLLHFHRHLGLLATALVLAHPITLLLAEPSFLRYLDPRSDWLRALSLWALLGALLLLTISSLWRQRLGLSYEVWRLLHGGLAAFLLVGGLGHALMVGHYLHQFWQQALIVAWIGLGLVLIVASRLVRPWLNRRRPWEVVALERERGDCWTLRLKPLGHAGLKFRPGQFAWFTLDESPMSMQQHPFSLSGSAERSEIRFTASVVGDFTASLGEVEPGTRAWVEGPMGSFKADPDPEVGLFMVAGGIGITPMLSMLRTWRDRGERRRILLIYANPTLADVTFHDELEQLKAGLDLEVIHVLEEPPEGWTGATGQVDAELLRACLERFAEPAQYLCCGPEPLMDLVESTWRRRGVDWRRVYTERFEVV